MVLNAESDLDPPKVEGGWMLPGKRTISLEWHLGQSIFFIGGDPFHVGYFLFPVTCMVRALSSQKLTNLLYSDFVCAENPKKKVGCN